MDLIKIEPLASREALAKTEDHAITNRRAKAVATVHGTIGLASLLGGFWGYVLALWIATPQAFLASLLIIVAGIVAIGVGMASAAYFFCPSDRRLLPRLFKPQAKAFFCANVDRRELLLDRASAFNDALEAFKALPAGTGADEIDAGVVENLCERRKGLEAEIADYLEDFNRATEDDRKGVTAIEAARGNPKRSDKRRLTEFNEKVGKLRDLDRALGGLHDSTEKGMTVDLSPFIAAQRLRVEYEEEHEALVASGLKPKRLPKPRVTDRKSLPAAT